MISLWEVRYEDKVDGEILWSRSPKKSPSFQHCVSLSIYERITSFFSSVQAKHIICEMFAAYFLLFYLEKKSMRYFLYKLLEFLFILFLCVLLTRIYFFNEKLQLNVKSYWQLCSQAKQAQSRIVKHLMWTLDVTGESVYETHRATRTSSSGSAVCLCLAGGICTACKFTSDWSTESGSETRQAAKMSPLLNPETLGVWVLFK